MTEDNINSNTFLDIMDDQGSDSLFDPHLAHTGITCNSYSNGSICIANKLPILHINARSIKNKFDDIQIFLASSGVDWAFICISETWLKDDLIQYFAIDNYDLFASCRSDGQGGGAAIYVNKKYEAKKRLDLSCAELQSVFVEVKLNSTNIASKMIIGEIYRPPNFPNTQFNEYLEKTIDSIDKEKTVCVLAGDFNYNLLNLHNDKHSLAFLNLMNSYGFSPTITLATRIQNEHRSLLDNIFVNDSSLVNKAGIIEEDLSDHFPVFVSLDVNQNKMHDKREYTTFDKSKTEELNQFLSNKLHNIYSITDPNAACVELIQVYTDGIKKFSKTVKHSRRRNPIKPWITPGILCAINRKTKLYKDLIHKKSPEAKNRYNQYRNILTKVLRDAKRLYYQGLFQEHKNNGRKTWELLNEVINKRKCKTSMSPGKFSDELGNVYEGNKISEGFNNFFTSVGANLEKDIPASDSSPLDYLSVPSYPAFDANLSTTPNEIKCIIKSLNPVGGGLDNINTKIILFTYEKCLPYLTYFFNLCLRTAVFPDKLKIGLIIPIHKTGDKSKFNNYRPISLLPIFSKILEKLIHSRLLKYFDDNGILNPLQFGFRKKHSTYMPLAHLLDEVAKSLQNNEITCGIYLDLKKAFDTVSLDILIKKLYFLGVQGDLYNLLKSYLSNRTQRTKFNQIVSQDIKVNMGVPQGSILGPLLFIIYINDLGQISDEAKFYFFADDTAITIKAPNVVDLQQKINKLLPKVTNWFNTNRLSLNTSKSNYQIYSKLHVNNFEIKLNGSYIMRQKQVKYLGVIMEENLKFEKHIINISSLISRNIGVMGRAKHFLSSRELLLLYNSLVLPHLNYCAVVWGRNYRSRLDKLIKLQKRAIRIIDHKPFLYPTSNLFKKYKMLKFPDIVKEQSIMIMLAFINKILPEPISEMFRLHVPVNTRNTRHFDVPFAASNYRSFTLSFSAPNIWNTVVGHLFRDIRKVPRNKFTLKKHVRKYLVSKYIVQNN